MSAWTGEQHRRSEVCLFSVREERAARGAGVTGNLQHVVP